MITKIFNFTAQTFIEFLWLLCSAAFGIALAAMSLTLPREELSTVLTDDIIQFMVVVIFNAALLRVIVRWFTDWADTKLQANQRLQQQQVNMAKLGVKMAVNYVLGRKIETAEPPAPEVPFSDR